MDIQQWKSRLELSHASPISYALPQQFTRYKILKAKYLLRYVFPKFHPKLYPSIHWYKNQIKET